MVHEIDLLMVQYVLYINSKQILFKISLLIIVSNICLFSLKELQSKNYFLLMDTHLSVAIINKCYK